jgi:hypothetical protein
MQFRLRVYSKLSQDPKPNSPAETKKITRILARCHLKYGNLLTELDGGLTPVGVIANPPPDLTTDRLHQTNPDSVLN